MSIKPDKLRLRHRIICDIRTFFSDHDYIETATPIRVAAPAMEDYIDAESAGECYLRTSPEFHMKRLVQAGMERIFQIGPCFRRGEQGRLHLPEFTMLEWYATGENYHDILLHTQRLVHYISAGLHGRPTCESRHCAIDFSMPWEEYTVAEAFVKFADSTVDAAIQNDEFERLLIDQIEPRFDRARPTILRDFPSCLGAFAKNKGMDANLVERWELYIGGIEVANAYTELTDANEYRRRLRKTAEIRSRYGREIYPDDLNFLNSIDRGLPPCAGCALGVDRLMMILTNSDRIDDVVAFPLPDS